MVHLPEAGGSNRTRGASPYCDLDAGLEGSGSADFQWRMVSDVERYLEPASGARFAVYGALPPPSVGLVSRPINSIN